MSTAAVEPEPRSPARQGDAAQLATGAGIALIGRVAGRAIHLAVQVAVARLLGVEIFGLYSIGWTTVRIGALIAPLGLDQGILRYGSLQWDGDRAALRSLMLHALGLAAAAGLVIGGALYALAPLLAVTVFDKPELAQVIRWFTPAFVLVAGLRVTAAATRLTRDLKWSVYSEELAQPAANLLLLCGFVLAGWELLGAVSATVASFGVAFALALLFLRRLLPPPASSTRQASGQLRTLLGFSVLVSLAGVCTALIMWSDVLMVGHFLSAADVGVYQAASQVSMLFSFILGGFVAIFAPMIADLHDRGEMARLEEIFRLSTKWTLYLTVPLYLVIALASEELLVVVFGPDFALGSLPLVILATGQMANVAMGTVGLVLVMTGFQTRWLALSLLILALDIGLNWLLIPRVGLPGAAIATAVSLSALFLLGLLQVRRILGIWPYDRRCVKLLAPALAVGGAAMLIRVAGPLPPLLIVLLLVGASTLIFGAGLILFGLDAEDRAFVRRVGSLIRPSRTI